MPNKYTQFSKTSSDNINFFIPEATLDYHDQGPLTEYDIEKQLNTFLEDSFNKNLSQVLVITGKGLNSLHGPVIRPFVRKLLRDHSLVANFKQASEHNGGEGALEIKLVQ